MKKKKQLSQKILRQIEILSKYYDVDLENRLIRLELRYEKVSELFEDAVVSTKKFRFKNEIFQRISQIMDTFPMEFKIDLQFKIDDYEGYDSKEIIESFKDSLEMFHYRIHRIKSTRWLSAVTLALVSMAILFFRIFALNNHIIEESYVIYEMLDITAWVFLWQGVTTLFLTPNEFREISFKILVRLHKVLLYQGDKLMFDTTQDEIMSHWIQVTRIERLSKRALIITGAFALATGITVIANGIELFLRTPFDLYSLINLIISVGLEGVISLLGGLGAISIYREKGPFQKFVPIAAVMFLIVDVIMIAFVAILAAAEALGAEYLVAFIVSNLLFFIVTILYFASYIILTKVRKQANKNAQRESKQPKPAQ